ncbi:DHA2 family efflux MFS transporter permease subunit [Nakamurella lactea]|uniref:DHA2 family efflux MFS transporter permease subunit n=1 Tax=Nakamurella lactea TaxID=459515 RepID=UPI000A050B9C
MTSAPASPPSTAKSAAPSQARRPPIERPLLVLAGVLALGAVMSLLDATIVSVGIDAIGSGLSMSLAQLQWVSAAYLLSLAVVMPVAGWASDRFGARRVWLTAITVFVGASVLCGLAWSGPALIALRVLQGLGGGLIQPTGQALLIQTAGKEKAPRLFSIIVVPVTLAPALGPVIGGVILSALDWRWLFWINLPIGLITLLIARRLLPKSLPRKESRLDRTGLALLPLGLGAVVYALSEAGTDGFGAVRVVIALVAGVALLVGYTVHAVRRPERALIDLKLFADRSFRMSTIIGFVLGAALYSSMFLLPLLSLQVLGATVIGAGLFLMPQGIGTGLAAAVNNLLPAGLHSRWRALIGVCAVIVGTVPLIGLQAGSGWLLPALGLLLRGFGMGLTMTALMASSYANLPHASIPRATSAYNVLNRVGGALGTAVLATVLTHQLSTVLPAEAFSATMWWATGLGVIALIPTALLPKIRM